MLLFSIFNYKIEFLVVGIDRKWPSCGGTLSWITTQKIESVLPLCLQHKRPIT